MINVRLKPGREKSVLRKHPWIFSGAIDDVQGSPGVGETVCVINSEGKFLAWGAFSPVSQIRIRIWSWDIDEIIDPEFLRIRITRSLKKRESLISDRLTNSHRLIYAESDLLPGLIVDRYDSVLVLQSLSAGIEYWLKIIVDLLVEITGIISIYERSDVPVRQLEGLPDRSGRILGPEPPEYILIEENELHFYVDIRRGHKTGFYLDQHSNRAFVRGLANDNRVLDCFSYTGGFTVNALAGGASDIVAIDTSSQVLSLGQKNIHLNNLPGERVEWIEGDVFQMLRLFRDQAREFDLIILDPPKFASTSRQIASASRGYKDINLLALKLLRPGGKLVTFSCSGGIDEILFQKILAGAALDAGANAQIIDRLHQDVDHPVGLNFPEGAYLKGFVISKGE